MARREPRDVFPPRDLARREGKHRVDRVVGLVPAFRLRLLGPAGDLRELLAGAGEVGVEHVRDPVLDRVAPAAPSAGKRVAALLPVECGAAEGASEERDPLLGRRRTHARRSLATSTIASVTSTIASMSATAICSSGVWISAIPLARFTHWRPRWLNTLASAAPPERVYRGSKPQRPSASAASLTARSSFANRYAV